MVHFGVHFGVCQGVARDLGGHVGVRQNWSSGFWWVFFGRLVFPGARSFVVPYALSSVIDLVRRRAFSVEFSVSLFW